jgi:hypothetical protein
VPVLTMDEARHHPQVDAQHLDPMEQAVNTCARPSLVCTPSKIKAARGPAPAWYYETLRSTCSVIDFAMTGHSLASLIVAGLN